MRDGVGTAFLAGSRWSACSGRGRGGQQPKIAVKFGIGLVLLVLIMANTRKESIPKGLWAGLLVLAVAEVCVAVLWSPVHS